MEAGTAERGGGQVQSQDGEKDGRNLCICVTLMFLGFLLLIGFGVFVIFYFPGLSPVKLKHPALNETGVTEPTEPSVDPQTQPSTTTDRTDDQSTETATTGGPEVSIFVDEDGTVRVTSPGYPDPYPADSELVWFLETVPGRKLLLQIEALETEEEFDFLYVGDGSQPSDDSTRFFTWTGTRGSYPESLLTAGNQAWIRLSSDDEYTEKGFAISVTSVDSSETLTCEEDQFDCGHAVCIREDNVCDTYEDCQDYSDEYNCGCYPSNPCQNGGNCTTVFGNSHECECPGTFIGKNCELDGRRTVFIDADSQVEITSPNYPDDYPPDVLITWVLQTAEDRRILLSFQSFQTELDRDIMSASDQEGGQPFFSWSGAKPVPNLLSSGKSVVLSLTSDSFLGAQGFSLQAASVPATTILNCVDGTYDCGHSVCIDKSWVCDYQDDCVDGKDELNCANDHNITESEPRGLASPRYPNEYLAGHDATWVFRTDELRRIRVEFHSFSTAKGRAVLWAGDGTNSTDTSTGFFSWSGARLPPSLISDASTMWLRFLTTSVYPSGGWTLLVSSVSATEDYSCSPIEFDCGHSVCIETKCDYYTDCLNGQDEQNCDGVYELPFEDEVQILSPNYPLLYPTGIHLTWLLRTGPDRKIAITFPAFFTDDGADVLRAGNGDDPADGASLFLSWSGTVRPPALLSSGPRLWIAFTSDDSGSFGGWSINANSVPATEELVCPPIDTFDCGRSVCIPASMRCDGKTHCVGGADENGCDE